MSFELAEDIILIRSDKTPIYLTKRVIDILLSIVGLAILIAILPVIGLLIKLDSKGPVFYRVDRVGRNMKIFKMYKFRTMLEAQIEVGESISPQFDPRVTRFGRFLRRTKINEAPQFINILKGEMTFVGPRPEAPDLAAMYPAQARRVFLVTPGLVGPSTILARNEEESFPPGVDVKKYYVEKILPGKVKLDLEYIENRSLFKDVKYILAGLKETLIGAVSKRHVKDNRSQIYLVISDLLLITFSYLLASVTAAKPAIGASRIAIATTLPVVIVVRLLCNIYFGMYSSLIRYISYYEILEAVKSITVGSVCLFVFTRLFELNYYSIEAALIDWVCLMLLLSGLRLGLRFYSEKAIRKTLPKSKHRILIYGATDAGYNASRSLGFALTSRFETIGFIDDAPDKYGKRLNGLKVLGNRFHIKALAQLYGVEELLIADNSIELYKLNEVIKICQESNITVRLPPSGITDFDFPLREETSVL